MPLNDTNSGGKPQEIAIIDLGSNSFHMIIARVVNGSLQVLSRLKQRVNLMGGLDSHNMLSEEAMERGVTALALFAERLQGFSPEHVSLVGTYALRTAINANLFLTKAEKVLPYPIEIVSGQEEARLIYMGTAHTQPEQGRRLVVDIGGGSTELVIGDQFDPILIESRDMGCVSFCQRFFPEQTISNKLFQNARIAAMQKLENIAWRYRMAGWQSALGASGTIKAVHNILLELGEKDGLITAERLKRIVSLTLQAKRFDDLELPGLSTERRAVFVPGLAILCGIFDALGIQELRISDGALREGVLYEIEGRFNHQDVRSRTTVSLAEHYNIDREQACRVRESVQCLYQQWQQQNRKLSHPQLEALLNWAAMLHEVGLSINHSGLQRHSAYILQHSNLPGFSQEHQLLLATLVRLHRKSLKLNELPRFSLFKKKQYLPLVKLLRLAVLLNNKRQATVKPDSLTLLTDENHWVLRFPTGFLASNNLLQLDLEQEQSYWQEITGWSLLIEELPATTDPR